MRRVFLAMTVVLFLVPAQEGLEGQISCHRAGLPELQNQPYTSKLWNGCEISLGPARNGGADGDGCTSRKKVTAAFAKSIEQEYPNFATRLRAFSEGAPASRSLQRNDWLKDLSEHETFLSEKLSAAEQKQIIDQVENTSFDAPDSWETELRVRRVSLGEADGLILRGSRLLCGGTGNCETWVFRHSPGKWLNLFEQEAPIASGFGFEQEASGGIKNFLVSANSSAGRVTRILFKFDGKFYRQSECYAGSVDGAAERKMEKVPCK